MKASIYMGTTQIDANKTASEVTALLMRSGARQIATDIDDEQRISGLRFVLMIQQFPLTFALPVRVDPLLKHFRDRGQAERVAWRQLLRWIQAQFAMIDIGMVQAHEVFYPYLLRPGTDQTMFQVFMDNGVKMLEQAK